MNAEVANAELAGRLSRGDYVVDPQEVAEAVLRRRPWWGILGGDLGSQVLEAAQVEPLAPPVAEG